MWPMGLLFYFSFVLPEINSRSLQTLLRQESSNFNPSAEPMDIESHMKGDIYFCPECNMVVKNEVTELKDRSICCDLCKLWYHFNCVGITNKSVQSCKQVYLICLKMTINM